MQIPAGKKQKKIEQEAKEQIENKIKKFNYIFDEAERWHKARIIREYIAHRETNTISNQDNFAEWLKWAKKKLIGTTRLQKVKMIFWGISNQIPKNNPLHVYVFI